METMNTSNSVMTHIDRGFLSGQILLRLTTSSDTYRYFRVPTYQPTWKSGKTWNVFFLFQGEK